MPVPVMAEVEHEQGGRNSLSRPSGVEPVDNAWRASKIAEGCVGIDLPLTVEISNFKSVFVR